ncbi:MAG: hypothetical protein LC128_10725 [Chitinophagales bacterium]|nr:hypothetical protein [Chitinophagales bacterium]
MKTIALNGSFSPVKRIAAIILAATIMVFTMQSCKKDSTSPLESSKYVELNSTMHNLWAEHMQWTYATVDAFFNNQTGLQASLDRLLQNQKDIGAAIVPYYGQAAGDQLAALLTEHIQGAVPVLQAAQAGDQPALQKALNDWHQNAQDIADFLVAANPKNWESGDMRDMMKGHIDQTTTYAVDLLQGNYKKAIEDYGEAFDHMMMMAGMLSEGIAKQFPNKF